MRSTELQINKWLHIFQSCEKSVLSILKVQNLRNTHLYQLNQNRLVYQALLWIENFMKNETNFTKLKKKAACFEKKKQTI